MLKNLISFELRNWAWRPAFGFSVLLLAVLVFYALHNGRQVAATQKAQIEKVLPEEKRVFETKKQLLDSVNRGLATVKASYQHPANALVAGQFAGAGKYVYKMPSPFALVSIGQSDIFPYHAKVSIMDQAETPSLQNPFHLASGQLDLSFVLVYLLPLLIIAFSYNVLSSEREQGTLKLLLSQPVGIVSVFAGKMLLRFGLLVLVCWVLVLVGLAVFGDTVFSIETPVLLLSVALYILFWFALALWVNLRGKSSAFNALALLGGWLLLVLIIPNIANAAAEILYPVPSRVAMLNDFRAAEQAGEKQRDSLLTGYYRANPQFVRKQEGQQEWQDYWRQDFVLAGFSERLSVQTIQKHERAIARQQAFASAFRFFSPAVLLQNTLNNIAANNTADFGQFRADTRRYFDQYRSFFKDKFLKDQPMSVADYDRIPVFQSAKRAAATRSWPDLAGLLGFVLLTVCLVALNARRPGQQMA